MQPFVVHPRHTCWDFVVCAGAARALRLKGMAGGAEMQTLMADLQGVTI